MNRRPTCEKCGIDLPNYYAKLCRTCWIKSKKHYPPKGKKHWNWIKDRKCRIKKCKKCGKKLHITSYYRKYDYCSSCVRMGKNNSNFKNDKTNNNKCNICHKKISWHAKMCNKCEKNFHKDKLMRALRKIKFHRHHLDLNIKNNKKSNILILPKGKHQLFHRIAYHYLLEKFGIKEILKYKKWFYHKFGLKDK